MNGFLLLTPPVPIKRDAGSIPSNFSGFKKSPLSRVTSNGSIVQPSNSSFSFSARSTTVSSTSDVTTAAYAGRKKIFDPNTLQYVDIQDMMSLFERKLFKYNNLVKQIKKMLEDAHLHDLLNLNNFSFNGGQAPLFTVPNVQQLRYLYFVAFETHLVTPKTQLLEPSAEYLVDVSIQESIASARINSYHSKADKRTSKTADKYINYLLSRNTKENRKRKSLAFPQKSMTHPPLTDLLPELEYRLTSFEIQELSESAGVRNLFLQSSFWDDVYHDVKYQRAPHGTYDKLPHFKVCRQFFVELLDVVLKSLVSVTCEIDSDDLKLLNGDELHELNKQCHYYFNNGFSEVFMRLRTFFFSIYTNLSQDSAMTDVTAIELLDIVILGIAENLLVLFHNRPHKEKLILLFTALMRSSIRLVFRSSTGIRYSSSVESAELPLSSPMIRKNEKEEMKEDLFLDLNAHLCGASSPEPTSKRRGFSRLFKRKSNKN